MRAVGLSRRAGLGLPKWCKLALIKFRVLSARARDSVTVSACFPVIPAAWITARPRIRRWILSFARTHPARDYHRDTFARQDSNERLACGNALHTRDGSIRPFSLTYTDIRAADAIYRVSRNYRAFFLYTVDTGIRNRMKGTELR